MRRLLVWFSIFAFAALTLTLAAQEKKKTSAAKKTTSAKTAKKSPSAKSAAKSSKSAPKKSSAKSSGKAVSKKTSKSAKKAPPRTTWRNRQSAPSPERYKQIQDALVAKGFLTAADATGDWGQNSADALKKFQAAQNIQSTGKIDSLSLIALGLGPKHDNSPSPKAPETPPQAP